MFNQTMKTQYQNNRAQVCVLDNPFPEGSWIGKTVGWLKQKTVDHIESNRYFDFPKISDEINNLFMRQGTDESIRKINRFFYNLTVEGLTKAKQKKPYVQLLNQKIFRTRFSTEEKQNLLSILVGYRVYCAPEVFANLSNYKIENDYEVEKNKEILEKCLSRVKEKNGDEKINLYMPFFRNCMLNKEVLNLSNEAKLKTLEQLMHYDVNVPQAEFNYFSQIVPKNSNEQILLNRLLYNVNQDIIRCPHPISLYNADRLVENYCLNNTDMNRNNFAVCTSILINVLQNSNRNDQAGFKPLVKVMEQKAVRQLAGFEYDLFSEQKNIQETIDKQMFTAMISQILEATREKGGIKKSSSKYLNEVQSLLVSTVEKHSFSKKEMRQMRSQFKEFSYHSDSTEDFFLSISNEMQKTYTSKFRNEVLGLNNWVKDKNFKDETERLAVRSTYIDILHERLINDKSIASVNLEEGLKERLDRFRDDPQTNVEKDALKANRIVQAVKTVYKNRDFIRNIKNTICYVDGGKKTRTAIIQRRGNVR